MKILHLQVFSRLLGKLELLGAVLVECWLEDMIELHVCELYDDYDVFVF